MKIDKQVIFNFFKLKIWTLETFQNFELLKWEFVHEYKNASFSFPHCV